MSFWQTLKQHFTRNDSPVTEEQSALRRPYQFVPRLSFFSVELQSEYVQGLRYTVRPGNDVLDQAAQLWVSQGKVALISKHPKGTQHSTLNGKGLVQ